MIAHAQGVCTLSGTQRIGSRASNVVSNTLAEEDLQSPKRLPYREEACQPGTTRLHCIANH